MLPRSATSDKTKKLRGAHMRAVRANADQAIVDRLAAEYSASHLVDLLNHKAGEFTPEQTRILIDAVLAGIAPDGDQ